jgi:adenylate kinase
MRKYIIMGVQGSGKGTQAKLLAGALDLEHLSVGDIPAAEVQAEIRRRLGVGWA